VAQGPVEEILNQMPEIETPENKEDRMKETDKEHPDVEDNDDLTQTGQLREAEEDRQVGNVSFKVHAKYFMHGAPASILFLVLIAIGAAQGKTKCSATYRYGLVVAIFLRLNNMLIILP
jgi:hypothetical protein